MATNYQDFDGIANEVMPLLIAHSDQFNHWSVEYPGYISLHNEGNGLWLIGTANGTWAADLYIAEEDYLEGNEPDHSVDTKLPADCQDAPKIAEALFKAMTEVL